MHTHRTGQTLTQARLDCINQRAGDKPLLNVDFIVGQPDSSMRTYSYNADWTHFDTQADRGSAYLNIIQGLTSMAYSNGGSKPFVGSEFFHWSDSTNESSNFRLVLLSYNANDAHHDTTS